MLSKNDGFILLELLLSLSALFMLCTFFIPLLLDLNNQSHQLLRNKKAKQLLFEELQANLIEDRTGASYSKFHNGTEYKIYWLPSPLDGQEEVCVKVVEQTFLPGNEICAKPE
ncbi:competence type IV pilus minor pilin ComGE [Neobacillus vireti]|uniref:competence type IV pilus minor pilin ComGE n=1 Tax=Neobacillus vireti TaxID=220686 RepID=UPI002FFE9AE6